MKYKGLVISGGGYKGLGYLGALEYLNEHKYLDNITHFSGSSIGSILCTYFCLGYTPQEILDATHTFSFKDLEINILNLQNSWALSDVTTTNRQFKNLMSCLPENFTLLDLFKKTQKHLYICTTNLVQKKSIYLSHENNPSLLVIDAIKASCAIPFVFPPFTINNILCIDACVSEYCPWKTLKLPEEEIILVYNVSDEPPKPMTFFNFIFQILRLFLQPLESNNTFKIGLSLNNIPTVSFKQVFNKDEVQKFFNQGYENCKTLITKH
tara:strand:+ start:483 stop:1283 length:801 start_codon:yes stop_codon:yes gene_type:complete